MLGINPDTECKSLHKIPTLAMIDLLLNVHKSKNYLHWCSIMSTSIDTGELLSLPFVIVSYMPTLSFTKGQRKCLQHLEVSPMWYAGMKHYGTFCFRISFHADGYIVNCMYIMQLNSLMCVPLHVNAWWWTIEIQGPNQCHGYSTFYGCTNSYL